MAWWRRNWLDGHTQSCGHWFSVQVVIKGEFLGDWYRGLEQQSVCDIFIGDMDSDTECTLCKFTDPALWCGRHTLEGQDGIQRDLERLERWG